MAEIQQNSREADRSLSNESELPPTPSMVPRNQSMVSADHAGERVPSIPRITSIVSNVEGQMGSDPGADGEKASDEERGPVSADQSPGQLARNMSAMSVASMASMELGDFERAWMAMLAPTDPSPSARRPSNRPRSDRSGSMARKYMAQKQNSREQLVSTPQGGSG